MAKQQKGKTKHKYFGSSVKGIKPSHAVFNPVVERAVATLLVGGNFKMNLTVAETIPLSAFDNSMDAVVVAYYHNGFEEIIVDPKINSAMASQGFNYHRILEQVLKVTTADGAPLSWLEGTNRDLVVPLCTTLGALIYIIRNEYDTQRIVEAAEWKAAQLTKKGKA